VASSHSQLELAGQELPLFLAANGEKPLAPLLVLVVNARTSCDRPIEDLCWTGGEVAECWTSEREDPGANIGWVTFCFSVAFFQKPFREILMSAARLQLGDIKIVNSPRKFQTHHDLKVLNEHFWAVKSGAVVRLRLVTSEFPCRTYSS
jgi:hypothetical protein